VPAVTATPGATPDGSDSGKQRDQGKERREPDQPAGASRRRRELPRPAVVRYALIVWVTAGAVGVLNGLWLLVFKKQEVIDSWLQANRNPNVTSEQIARGATTVVWAILVISVVLAVLFSLFAYKAQDGARRARLTLTLLCVIVVVFYYLLVGTFLGLLSGLLALAGTVLLYLPQANEYFRADEPVR
jgi:hypothetical protein